MSVISRIFGRSNSRFVPTCKYGRLSDLLPTKNCKFEQRFASLITLKQSRHEDNNHIGLSSVKLAGNINLTRSFASNSALGLQKEFEYNTISKDLEKDLELAERLLRNGKFLTERYLHNLTEKLKKSGVVDPSQMLFILRCCTKNATMLSPERRHKYIEIIWKIFIEKDSQMDISHYNAYLQVLSEVEQKLSPLDFLAMLESKNVTPNRVTYGRLIHSFCLNGDIAGASQILEIMKDKGITLGESVFNSLIIGNSKANDMEGALSILETMNQRDLKPSSETYGALFLAYAEHGDIEGMNKLLEQCEGEQIEIPGGALMSAVFELGKQGLDTQINKILAVFREQRNEDFSHVLSSVICRLVNDGQDERAHRLFSYLPVIEGREHMWSFYPILLVSSGLKLDKVVKYCSDLRRNGWNISAFDIAFEEYLHLRKFEVAFQLLKAMHQQGIPTKEHYFYPIIRARAKAGDREGVYSAFDEMLNQNIIPGANFYFNILLPSLTPHDDLEKVKDAFYRLLNYKGTINVGTIYSSVVRFIMKKDLDLAAEFVNQCQYGVFCNSVMRNLLLAAYQRDYNAKSAACVLRQMLPYKVRFQEDHSPETREELEEHYGGMREFLVLLVQRLKEDDALSEHFVPFLEEMIKNGVRLLPGVVSEVVEHVGPSAMTPQIQSLLDELCTLELVPMANGKPLVTMNNNERRSDAKDEDDATAQLRRMIRARNFSGIDKLIETMKAEGQSISPNIQTLLLGAYLERDRLEDAEALVNGLVDEYPDYTLSASYAVSYALALVKAGRGLDAVKSLLMLSSEDGTWNEGSKPQLDNLRYLNKVRGMLNTVAKMEDLNLLKLLQEALVSRKFVDDSAVLQSSVEYFARLGKIEEGIATLETLVEKYNVCGGKNDLLRACIEKEDTDSIQKIMDLNTKVHGEMNTLYDLAFAFIHVGKVKQAKKIFQTPGLRALTARLNNHCEMFLKNDNLTGLEALIEATKPIFNFGRDALYDYLLQGTVARGDTDKALEIWTKMQEDNVVPSRDFLKTLGNFLQSRDIDVPFTVPESQDSHQERPGARQQRSQSRQTSSSSPQDESFKGRLERALDGANYDQALDLWHREKESGENISQKIRARIIGVLTKKEMLEEAILECQAMKNANGVGKRSVRMLLDKLMLKGDVDGLKSLKEISKVVLHNRNYEYMLDMAFLNADRIEERISSALEALSDPQRSSDEAWLAREAVNKIVLEKPQFIPQLQELAERGAQKGAYSICGSLFDVYFSVGKNEEAVTLYEKYLKDKPSLSVRSTCTAAEKFSNLGLLEGLLQVLEKHPEGRDGLKGFVGSSYIHILVQQKEVTKALDFLKDSIKTVPLATYSLVKLRKLETATRESGLTFPYDLQALDEEKRLARKRESDSSSSDSDDEDVKRRNEN